MSSLDSPIRSAHVAAIYGEIIKRFPEYLSSLPQSADEIASVVGFPSRRARGKPDTRLGAEMLLNDTWQGNSSEKALVSVHPEKTQNVEEAAWAVLYGALRAQYRPRMARYYYDRLRALNPNMGKEVSELLGPFPQGVAVINYSPRDRNRMRKYLCNGGCKTIIRHAGDNLQAEHKTSDGTVCGKFELREV